MASRMTLTSFRMEKMKLKHSLKHSLQHPKRNLRKEDPGRRLIDILLKYENISQL